MLARLRSYAIRGHSFFFFAEARVRTNVYGCLVRFSTFRVVAEEIISETFLFAVRDSGSLMIFE